MPNGRVSGFCRFLVFPYQLFPRARLRRKIRGFGNQPETGNRFAANNWNQKYFAVTFQPNDAVRL